MIAGLEARAVPACTVREDRSAKPPRWWHYPLAVVLPFPFVVLAAPVVLLREWPGDWVSAGSVN